MVTDTGWDNPRSVLAREIAARAIRLDLAAAEMVVGAMCGDDALLRAEVRRIIEENCAETVGVEVDPRSPPSITMSVDPGGEASTTSLPTIERIGPYRVVREVGSGGFGQVYLAMHEGELFRRSVAIKVVKRGFDSEDLIRRFELERQVLAGLNHPNIARLYAGGTTTDGRPYFAMEYVEGLPIDEYCDRNRLGVDDRLAIFRQVCAGVHYAHQNLVVHRDLKPRNILVTGEGIPKLLDFGIAKLLNSELSLIAHDPTAPEMRIMTPEYASPEQVRGDSVTTASDVYSLGVLLYELLTGHRPYHIDRRIRAEIERVVCEVEPTLASDAVQRVDTIETADERGGTTTKTVTPEEVSRTRGARPDTLRRRLSGDLDNIILMSMRKESHRRYPSVERLIDDIDRHQSGHPITARPNELGYRLSKFLRRNKAGVVIAVALAVALVMGGWATLVDARSRAASAELAAARAAVDAAEAHAREDKLRAELAEDRANHEQQRASDAEELAIHHAKTTTAILEAMTPAMEALVDSIQDEELKRAFLASAMREPPAGSRAENVWIFVRLAQAYDQFGVHLASQRGFGPVEAERALEQYRMARAIRAPLLTEASAPREVVLGAVVNRLQTATVYRRLGREAEAYGELNDALTEGRAAAAKYPDWIAAQRVLSTVLNDLGSIARSRGDLEEMSALYAESLEVATRTATLAPTVYQVRRDLTIAQIRVADDKARRGDLDGARALFIAAIDERQRLLDEAPDAGRRRDVGVAHRTFGVALREAGRYDEALQQLELFRKITAELVAEDPLDQRVAGEIPLADSELARLHLARGDGDSALDAASRAVSRLQELVDQNPSDMGHATLLATVRADLGRAQVATGKVAVGRETLNTAITELRRLTDMMPNATNLVDELARAVADRDALGD